MAMKFQREATSGFAITGYTADAISVAGVEYGHSLRVAHGSAAAPWSVTTFAEQHVVRSAGRCGIHHLKSDARIPQWTQRIR